MAIVPGINASTGLQSLPTTSIAAIAPTLNTSAVTPGVYINVTTTGNGNAGISKNNDYYTVNITPTAGGAAVFNGTVFNGNINYANSSFNFSLGPSSGQRNVYSSLPTYPAGITFTATSTSTAVLTVGTAYNVTVSGVSSTLGTTNSATSSFTAKTAPLVPTIGSASTGTSSITWNWTAVANSGNNWGGDSSIVYDVYMYVYLPTSLYTSSTGIASSTTSWSLSSVPSNTYYIDLGARNTVGISSYAQSGNYSVSSAPPPVYIPPPLPTPIYHPPTRQGVTAKDIESI